MEYDESTPDDWHNVPSFAELTDALHKLALKTHPESDYAEEVWRRQGVADSVDWSFPDAA
jgi:hypothetical protein